MRKIAIRGPAEAVAKAKALVEAQVHYAETAAVHHVSQTLEIPEKATGLIIGRGGATVKGIEAASGAMLNIDTKLGRCSLAAASLPGANILYGWILTAVRYRL